MTTCFYNSDLWIQILPGQIFATEETWKDEIQKHYLLTEDLLSKLWIACQQGVISPVPKLRMTHRVGVGSCVSLRRGCCISRGDRHWEARNSLSSQWHWSQLIQTSQCPTHTTFLSWEVHLTWRYTEQLCFLRAILTYETVSSISHVSSVLSSQ